MHYMYVCMYVYHDSLQPYNLPGGFVWAACDIDDESNMNDIYQVNPSTKELAVLVQKYMCGLHATETTKAKHQAHLPSLLAY